MAAVATSECDLAALRAGQQSDHAGVALPLGFGRHRPERQVALLSVRPGTPGPGIRRRSTGAWLTRSSAAGPRRFSAICTHAGCVVGEVTGGTINCMYHGSNFDITNGSVKKSPATKGPAPAKANVKSGSLSLG
ncbi:Rieske 2Fe-2S domain-containing protein [Streptomyces sp. NBC_00400]|uniref:Rieske 2Fe-2S domain-containing protein n=1 Tax=Streptomyces sp. NBC_00400 TaxID=2975737 RepID=UPI002E206B7F